MTSAHPDNGEPIEAADEARVMDRLADGYWHIFTDPDDARVVRRLAAEGRLEVLKQARRGFPPLYRLPQS